MTTKFKPQYQIRLATNHPKALLDLAEKVEGVETEHDGHATNPTIIQFVGTKGALKKFWLAECSNSGVEKTQALNAFKEFASETDKDKQTCLYTIEPIRPKGELFWYK